MGVIMHDMPFDEQWDEFIEQNKRDIELDPLSFMRYAKLVYFWQYKHWFLSLLNFTGEVIMTRGVKKPAAKPAAKTSQQFTEFVNVSLTEQDTPAVQEYLKNTDDLLRAFEDMCVGGYRVGFSYDSQRDALICSFTCKDGDSPNHNKTMTSFAGDWFTALGVNLYKHHVMLKGVWNTDAAKNRPAFG